MVSEIEARLRKGSILEEWRYMRVVVIPKPVRDLCVTTNWRPINLINCVGKIGE